MGRLILVAVMLVGCGGKDEPFRQKTAIGESCDPTGTSEHPADCAAPLICTAPFKAGQFICTKLPGCASSEDTYLSPSGLTICLPVCGAGCSIGTCSGGVCVPAH